jgi:hypothetical protein
MKSNPVDECEINVGGHWTIVDVKEALERRDETMRCRQCHGRVFPHKAGTTDQRAHFEHSVKHEGCPLKAKTFSGSATPHPNALF